MKPTSEQKQPLEDGKKYHIDCEFEGERLVDDVKLIELLPQGRFALVHSHKLLSDILIPRTELKEIEPDSKEGLHTQGEWKFNKHETGRYCGDIECELGKGENGIMNIRTIAIVLKNAGEEESKANAELIVKAINERKALLEHLENCVELLKWCGSSLTDKGKNTVKEANLFLNNAKNI